MMGLTVVEEKSDACLMGCTGLKMKLKAGTRA